MITGRKIGQSAKWENTISFFRLPFGDENLINDESISSLAIIL